MFSQAEPLSQTIHPLHMFTNNTHSSRLRLAIWFKEESCLMCRQMSDCICQQLTDQAYTVSLQF